MPRITTIRVRPARNATLIEKGVTSPPGQHIVELWAGGHVVAIAAVPRVEMSSPVKVLWRDPVVREQHVKNHVQTAVPLMIDVTKGENAAGGWAAA
jgi:hypothetical protein